MINFSLKIAHLLIYLSLTVAFEAVHARVHGCAQPLKHSQTESSDECPMCLSLFYESAVPDRHVVPQAVAPVRCKVPEKVCIAPFYRTCPRAPPGSNFSLHVEASTIACCETREIRVIHSNRRIQCTEIAFS